MSWDNREGFRGKGNKAGDGAPCDGALCPRDRGHDASCVLLGDAGEFGKVGAERLQRSHLPKFWDGIKM